MDDINRLPEMMKTVKPPDDWLFNFIEAWSRAERWIRHDVFDNTEVLEVGEWGRSVLGDQLKITDPGVIPHEW